MSPIRKKNGLTGNEPGAVSCMKIADPSSRVLMIARIAISQATLRRKPVSIIVARPRQRTQRVQRTPRPDPARSSLGVLGNLCVLGMASSSSQLRDEIEDRHIHRDYDAANDAAEQRDHDRLEQRQQTRDRRVDLLFVEVRDL